MSKTGPIYNKCNLASCIILHIFTSTYFIKCPQNQKAEKYLNQGWQIEFTSIRDGVIEAILTIMSLNPQFLEIFDPLNITF